MSAVLEIQKTAPKTEVFQNGQILDARLISVKEYDQMIEYGILTTKDKVELLYGVIIKKTPKGTKHAALNDLVGEIFREKLRNQIIVRNQNPIVLDDFSEPEPDIVLAKPPREKYFENHPTPEDILLIVEISDTTLGRDRFAKGSAYAKAGIRQYLVLNVAEETVEDYRNPSADGYGSKQTLRKNESFTLDAFPEIEIKVDDLF
ncbi:MAG: Uma2 family endonuclease [Acidobacteria bacterium]|nr:Uma2 family endonuclease [Acidobacteriota bacterium]